MQGIRVIITGKKRLIEIAFFLPSQTWIIFDTNIGKIIKAIAVGKSKKVAKIGTATSGRPIPRIPLTVPAKNNVNMQNISDCVLSDSNSKLKASYRFCLGLFV